MARRFFSVREPGSLLIICDIYKDNVLVRRQSMQMSRSNTVIKIGKLPSSDLKLDDAAVSRMHAVMEVIDFLRAAPRRGS
jgi:hypothetical protein